MSESLPSVIQTSAQGYYRRHNSHESFGFEANSQSTDDIAPNLPLPDVNNLYEHHDYAERPIQATLSSIVDEKAAPQIGHSEVFSSNLAIDDGTDRNDVDYGDHSINVESRAQDTSFMLEKVVEQAPNSQERLYSSIQPSCRPSKYIEHTSFLNDPIQRFVQILIWNIKGRIRQNENKANSQPQLYSVIRIMELLCDKLERQIFVPSYTHRSLISTKPQLRRQCNIYHEKLFAKLTEKEAEYISENNAMFAMETKIASQVGQSRVPKKRTSDFLGDQHTSFEGPNDYSQDYRQGLYIELLTDAISETEKALSRLLKTIIAKDAYTTSATENLEAHLSGHQ